MNTSKEEIIVSLFKNNMIKIAENESEYFTLKSGNKTPIYINLRNMCTDTKLLDYICSNLYSSNSNGKDIVKGIVITGNSAALGHPIAEEGNNTNTFVNLLEKNKIKECILVGERFNQTNCEFNYKKVIRGRFNRIPR